MAGPGWRNRNRVGAESLQSPTEKAGHRQATVVDQQFDIGHPRMIIDRDMQALPTKPVMDIHVPPCGQFGYSEHSGAFRMNATRAALTVVLVFGIFMGASSG